MKSALKGLNLDDKKCKCIHGDNTYNWVDY